MCDAKVETGDYWYCYVVQGSLDESNSLQTHADALEACQALGGTLPTLTSRDLNDRLHWLVTTRKLLQVWLGLQEYFTTWQWITGNIGLWLGNVCQWVGNVGEWVGNVGQWVVNVGQCLGNAGQ